MSEQEKIDFYKKYAPAAIWQHIRSGIPASVTLAQMSIESNYGTSALAKNANNYFGIKAYSNPENLPIYYASDDLANEPFRVYATAKDSIKDHSKFLQTNSRYNYLFYSNNYKDWSYGLQAKGYATAPTYANTLINRIEKYNLQRFDFIGNHKYLIFFAALVVLSILTLVVIELIKSK